jgi:hypothetical protein
MTTVFPASPAQKSMGAMLIISACSIRFIIAALTLPSRFASRRLSTVRI